MPRGRGKGIVKIGDKCTDCGSVLTIMNVSYHLHYIRPRCDSCFKIRYNAWKKESRKDPIVLQKHKEDMRRRFIRNTYNITETQYNEMVELHQGGCAICRQPCKTHEKLSVDHDHKTGEVRGLLCQKCNSAIAMLNEDEDLFFSAMEYLKKYKWSKVG